MRFSMRILHSSLCARPVPPRNVATHPGHPSVMPYLSRMALVRYTRRGIGSSCLTCSLTMMSLSMEMFTIGSCLSLSPVAAPPSCGSLMCQGVNLMLSTASFFHRSSIGTLLMFLVLNTPSSLTTMYSPLTVL